MGERKGVHIQPSWLDVHTPGRLRACTEQSNVRAEMP
jgi:hypothetical protein